MPQLEDPNFKRGVVLLVQHDSDGTFGLVLNREVELTAANLCSSLDVRWNGQPGASINWGGPVQPQTGWVLFNEGLTTAIPDDEITEVTSGLYFAGSLEVLRTVAEEPPTDIMIFLGYAGWGLGQLEAELAAGAWIVAPLDTDTVFGVEPDGMWDHVVRGLGIDPGTLVSTSGVH
jgi:putative transcriptional regulator